MIDSAAALARSVHDALSPTMAITRRLELPPSLHVSHAALATHPATEDAAGGLSMVLAAHSGGRAWLVVLRWDDSDLLQGTALLLPPGCTAHQPCLYQYVQCVTACVYGDALCTPVRRYKGKGPESVVCLVETQGPTEDAGSLHLVQLPTEGLSWAPLGGGAVDLGRVLEDGGGVQEAAAVEGVRSRCVCQEEAWGVCALDVSGQRGLAAVLLRGEVVTLFDVQDEEEEGMDD